MAILPVCMTMYTCRPGTHGGQKRASDPRNWSYSNCELPSGYSESNFLNHGAIPPAPASMFVTNK